jgi:hypothetical protein
MPNLLGILEGIWLRNGPLVSLLYPDAKPSYRGRHQHLNILDGLAARRPAQVRRPVRDDLMEGGRALVRLLEEIEAGRVVPLDAGAAAGCARQEVRAMTRLTPIVTDVPWVRLEATEEDWAQEDPADLARWMEQLWSSAASRSGSSSCTRKA